MKSENISFSYIRSNNIELRSLGKGNKCNLFETRNETKDEQ